jgi:hypothetical protein
MSRLLGRLLVLARIALELLLSIWATSWPTICRGRDYFSPPTATSLSVVEVERVKSLACEGNIQDADSGCQRGWVHGVLLSGEKRRSQSM